MQQTLQELVRKAEQDYVEGTTTISKHVQWSMYENIEKIDAYLNSTHTTGLIDSLEREKPFFNIVTSATNIWYRATDIDRRNIRIKAPDRKHYVASLVATAHLQEYMKREDFGTFLNDWGRTQARYGSAVLKFVEKGGRLHTSVVPWNRLIVDTVDFENNMVVEKLELTPAQLRMRKGYDQEQVELLIDSTESRELLSGENKDNKADYITLYEAHGELPLSLLTDKENDEKTYVQQMHVISFVEKSEKGKFDDFTLVSGREKKSPYMITHLIKEDGRTQSIGAVEHLFEAQWMVNHTAKAIKDQLDLASKMIFQTSDSSFVGKNVLTQMETGDIMIHSNNEPLTQVNNNSHDITAIQSYQQQWQVLGNEITSTPDAIKGNTMPSGTAFRQVAILNQESHSLFELMTENRGLDIERAMREHILPFVKKKMDTIDELSAELDESNLARIDAIYVPKEAIKRRNREIIDSTLQGQLPEVADVQMFEAEIKQELGTQGNQRFIKPSDISEKKWSDYLSDFIWEATVEVTSENTDKEAVMTTLSTVLQTIAGNPMVLQDPNMKLLFNRILEETGSISPIELAATQTPTPQQQGPIDVQSGERSKVGGEDALQKVTNI